VIEVLVPIFSGVGGAIIGTLMGSVVTWILATRSERNRARREVLVHAAEALEDYRVAYAQWYVEYLSPEAQGLRGHWAKLGAHNPDPVYLQLMRAVDEQAGRLRVIQARLFAHFRQEEIERLWQEIAKVLVMGSGHQQADPRDVDHVAAAARDIIPDLIRKYL